MLAVRLRRWNDPRCFYWSSWWAGPVRWFLKSSSVLGLTWTHIHELLVFFYFFFCPLVLFASLEISIFYWPCCLKESKKNNNSYLLCVAVLKKSPFEPEANNNIASKHRGVNRDCGFTLLRKFLALFIIFGLPSESSLKPESSVWQKRMLPGDVLSNRCVDVRLFIFKRRPLSDNVNKYNSVNY